MVTYVPRVDGLTHYDRVNPRMVTYVPRVDPIASEVITGLAHPVFLPYPSG